MSIDDLARGGPSNGVGTLRRAEESQVETLTRVNGKTRSGRLSQLPQKWEGNVTAAAEEDEASAFLTTLRDALYRRFIPTNQHVQILLYLVLYEPPKTARNAQNTQLETPPTATKPTTWSLPSDSKEHIAQMALDLLFTILQQYPASDIGRLIPQIDRALPATDSVPVSITSRSRLYGKAAPKGRYSSGTEGSSSPEKHASARAGTIPRDTRRSASTTVAETSGPHGRGKLTAKGKRKRQSGIVEESEMMAIDLEEGAMDVDNERLASDAKPAWFKWGGMRQSKLQKATYKMSRSLLGPGLGGTGGPGIWPLLYATTKPSEQSKRPGPLGGSVIPPSSSPLSSLDDSQPVKEEEASDGESDDDDEMARAAKGEYGLSEGGWKLLAWLIKLWEKDAKERNHVSIHDKRYIGSPSILFLHQLPSFTSTQLSNADSVRQVFRAAYHSDYVVDDAQGSISRQNLATRLLALLANTAIPSPLGPAAFHPPSFVLDTLAMLRQIDSTAIPNVLHSLGLTIPWPLQACLWTYYIEDMAGIRADRDRQRKARKRSDFAPPIPSDIHYHATDLFPPKLTYVPEFVAAQPLPDAADVDKPARVKHAKMTLLTILLTHKTAYLDDFQHRQPSEIDSDVREEAKRAMDDTWTAKVRRVVGDRDHRITDALIGMAHSLLL